MFTLDGELRDEYRYLDDGTAGSAVPAAEPAPPPPESPRAAATEPRPGARKAPEIPRVEGYPEGPASTAPRFFDLVGLLAEPASVYLREASAGDLGTMAGTAEKDQNLELARLHIDLLEVLQKKTAGNLDSQEQAMIDDIIYRLRLAYVRTQR